MGYAHRAVLAGGLGLAASILVACGGSSGLLSGGQAGNLNAQLDQVSQAVNAGQCAAAANAASAFSLAVQNLPGSVNAGLVNNLQQGAQTISVLAARDCRLQSTTTTTTTSSSTTSSSTTTTTSSSTPTTTSSTTSTTSTPTSSTATSTTSSGTSTTSGSGGAGLGGTTTVGGTGGAGTGNGGGNAQ